MNELTPMDAELFQMLRSLFNGQEMNPQDCGEYYELEIDYRAHPNTDYLNAVCNAIRGRLGDRLINIEQSEDKDAIIIRVKYAAPVDGQVLQGTESNPDAGMVYCKRLGEIRAIQVTMRNEERMRRFVGGGDIETIDGQLFFTFLNANGMVFQRVAYGDYIIFENPGKFYIMGREKFEQEYERK